MKSLDKLEFTTALYLKQFRSEINLDERCLILSKFDEHEKKGFFIGLGWIGLQEAASP